MNLAEKYRIEQFLREYPGMSIAPSRGSKILLRGTFSFSANPKDGKEITDAYTLEIRILDGFPKSIPIVKETGDRIPRDDKHHVNPDHSLCLGSPLRLLELISIKPNLIGFSEKCLVPFLYAVSIKLNTGEDFIFSELNHGSNGILDDYMDIFGFKDRSQAVQALKLLGMKQRLANKKSCPCNCGLRLGKCSFNKKLRKYRHLASRTWFRKHTADIETELRYPRKLKVNNPTIHPYENRIINVC